MFNMMLARDSSLHCAVLQTDTADVTKLLEDGCDVSAMNMGGRTVTFLIATNGPCVRMTNRNSNYKVSLHNTDSVLHCPHCKMPQSRTTGAM
jgi:hypothetical protein